jgi:hypothetical protein
MAETDITNLIREQLPQLIAQEPLVRDFVLRTVSDYYAGKQETESKFDRILAELQRDREEQARKWDENNRKWDENNKRLDKMQEQTDQTLVEMKYPAAASCGVSRKGISVIVEL